MNTGYVILGVLAFFGALTAVFSVFTVSQQDVAVIERFGKFARVAGAGLNFKIPWIEWISGYQTLRIQPLDVEVETKTKDNVFVNVKVTVQYFVLPNKVYEAHYKLEDPDTQIEAFVFDTVRARVPKMDLDNVFDNKDEVADAVKQELSETMDDFGLGIVKALVTDIDPDENVKAAMNEINAAQRLRVAANEKGEADKILAVKAAEAEAESKKLQGEGIAAQRKAIIAGLRESVKDFEEAVPGATAQDVLNLVLMTQYFDTLKEIGATSNTIMLPHSPGGMADIADQIRNATIAANSAST